MHRGLEKFYLATPAFVQNLAISAFGRRIRRERFDRRYDEWMALLEKSERYSAVELETYQNERLAALIDHAYRNVPYYGRVMRERNLEPRDIRTVTDLPKLPLLTKEQIRSQTNELIARGLTKESLKASPTSGTTGSPLTVYWDHDTDVLWNAMIWRHRAWAGTKFGQRYGTLLGRVIVSPGRSKPPFWRRNYPWNQVLFSTFHLGRDTIPSYVEAIDRLGVQFLEAYPSTAYILAVGLERLNLSLSLRAVFTSSEPLLDVQRELIESRLGTEVYDYYGMSEAVMFAGECSAHQGLHHHAELSVVEVLDGDDRPAASGTLGRLVGTTLHNYAMPLIRYEIGDLTSRLPRTCDCGRAHPLFSGVTTKAEDIIVTPDGRLISPSVLTHPFKPLKGLLRSQLLQEKPDELRVLLVCADDPPAETIEQVREGLALRLGPEMRIAIQQVDGIPLGPGGKFRWVVSRVGLDRATLSGNLYSIADDEPVGGGTNP